jgi:hypothetical protein
MIQNSDPRVGPRVLLAHNFYLGGFSEFVYWNNFPIVVERSDSDDLSGADVDEPVGVEGAIVVADIESRARRDRLYVGVKSTGIVRQLEPTLDW